MRTIVAYTDGGARPNPGDTGYGIHMIITNDNIKHKQIKSKYKLTPNGYVEKNLFRKDKDIEIGLEKVIDVYGYDKQDTTNNMAELRAIWILFNLLLSTTYEELFMDIDKIVIKLDSNYVLGFLKKIENNHEEFYDIPNAKLINEIRELYKQVKKKYKEIELVKVSAHIGHIGNEKADMLATMGLYKNKESESKEFKNIVVVNGEDYYKIHLEKHPLLDNKLLFKFTNMEYIDRYYLFNYKEENDVGRRLNDVIYTVVDLNGDFPELNDISRKFNNSTTSIIPYLIKIDNIYNKDISANLLLYKEDYLKVIIERPYRITTINDITLATEIYPPGLAFVAQETFRGLSQILDDYKNNTLPPQYKIIDITDYIYTTNKKGKTTIKKEIVNDKYVLTIKKDTIDKNLIANVNIKLGLDILKRNVLKRIESKEPTVKLLIHDHKGYITYYTLIITKENNDKYNYVLAMNKYANLIYKKESK